MAVLANIYKIRDVSAAPNSFATLLSYCEQAFYGCFPAEWAMKDPERLVHRPGLGVPLGTERGFRLAVAHLTTFAFLLSGAGQSPHSLH